MRENNAKNPDTGEEDYRLVSRTVVGIHKVEVLKMTIDEAKDVYKKNSCSLFVMAREDLVNYNLYKCLNIEKKLEMRWKGEVIEELIDLLKEKGDYKIFNQLYDLAESFHDSEKLKLMIESIKYIRIKDTKTSLCIAETIMGRKLVSARSGMIFWAYDIGAKKDALELIRKVMFFIDVKTDSEELKERAYRDMKIINEIIDVLFEGK